jgi:mRNA deadenylase 3'-5' endonuclease subunit Ccr4
MKHQQHRLCLIQITRKRLKFICINIYIIFCFRYDFKGIIDYVFYSTQLMRVLGVLGPLDPEWLQTNKIVGCPHPNVPSDHFSLLVEFELNPSTNENSKTSVSTRRQ